MLVYFDTSAVNFFWQRNSVADAVATKAFQEVRGRRWAISPVTVFEILNTTDESRREELIFFAQHLFSEYLLPSPEELLVGFIEEGCPSRYRHRELRSTSDLAKTWRNICHDKRKTFVFDAAELRRRFGVVTPIVRDLHRLSRNRKIEIDRYSSQVNIDISLEKIVSNLSWVKRGGSLSGRDRQIYKIAVFYLMLFLCAEVGVDPAPIKKFWAKIGISGAGDRILYAISELEVLVRRGPILLMAMMTYVQAEKKFSRGVYWDSLHCLYLTYVDWLLTEDVHFEDMKKALDGHPFQSKIHRPSEMQWNYHPRESPGP